MLADVYSSYSSFSLGGSLVHCSIIWVNTVSFFCCSLDSVLVLCFYLFSLSLLLFLPIKLLLVVLFIYSMVFVCQLRHKGSYPNWKFIWLQLLFILLSHKRHLIYLCSSAQPIHLHSIHLQSKHTQKKKLHKGLICVPFFKSLFMRWTYFELVEWTYISLQFR